MAWTNITDVGPCRIEIEVWGPGIIPPSEYASWGIESVGFDDTGAVVVTGPSLPGMAIHVFPEFDTESKPARAINLSADGTQLQQMKLGPAENVRESVDFDDFTSGSSPVLPDPMTFGAEGEVLPYEWSRAAISCGGGD